MRQFILLSSGNTYSASAPMSAAKKMSKKLLSGRKKKASFTIRDISTKKEYRYCATKSKQNNKYVINVTVDDNKKRKYKKRGGDCEGVINIRLTIHNETIKHLKYNCETKHLHLFDDENLIIALEEFILNLNDDKDETVQNDMKDFNQNFEYIYFVHRIPVDSETIDKYITQFNFDVESDMYIVSEDNGIKNIVYLNDVKLGLILYGSYMSTTDTIKKLSEDDLIIEEELSNQKLLEQQQQELIDEELKKQGSEEKIYDRPAAGGRSKNKKQTNKRKQSKKVITQSGKGRLGRPRR